MIDVVVLLFLSGLPAAVLGVTFPFNILAGIPLYYWLSSKLLGADG